MSSNTADSPTYDHRSTQLRQQWRASLLANMVALITMVATEVDRSQATLPKKPTQAQVIFFLMFAFVFSLCRFYFLVVPA